MPIAWNSSGVTWKTNTPPYLTLERGGSTQAPPFRSVNNLGLPTTFSHHACTTRQPASPALALG
jgi:hypothetical protein